VGSSELDGGQTRTRAQESLPMFDHLEGKDLPLGCLTLYYGGVTIAA
jgi:hypothetical protein